MLDSLHVRGFKSLVDVKVSLPKLTVLFGPNAAGKSNFLDAIQFLSASATCRTLAEALGSPIRGFPVEAFTLPPGGLPELLRASEVKFDLAGQLRIGDPEVRVAYDVGVSMQPATGKLSLANERLVELGRAGKPRGKPRIDVDSSKSQVLIRRRGKAGRELREDLGQNHTTLSVESFEEGRFPEMAALRTELSTWRTYYLDPRMAMRTSLPPQEVDDIGATGDRLAVFLYGLKQRTDRKKYFEQVQRLVRTVIPTVDAIDVKLNEQRAQIELFVRQNGIDFSSRVISEGTLRVLALAAICVNPFKSRLISFEEPENGVQPKRLESIAELLAHLSLERGVQTVVNTHSPLFVAQTMRLMREHPNDVALIGVRMSANGSVFTPVHDPKPLFEDEEMRNLLSSDDDVLIEAALLRGLLGD